MLRVQALGWLKPTYRHVVVVAEFRIAPVSLVTLP